MKPDILYYSDCSFFAGCENMIANFLNDQTIQNDFSLAFAYNYSEKYEQGLNSRVSNDGYQKFPLRLIKQITFQKPANSFLVWSITHKVFFAFYIPLCKYFSVLINTFILFHFFKRHKVDILHINNGGYPGSYSCYAAVIAGKMSGISKIIYVVNNLTNNYAHPFRWLDYPIDFFIKKWVTVFITGSMCAGERLKNVLHIDEKKQITINNGIQKRRVTLTKEEFKVKYSIPEEKVVACVVANLEKRKGHIFLLEAIGKIKKQNPYNLNTFYIFEGVGPEKENLRKYIIENELAECILMVDYIPDIYNLLNASDFVILPSIASEDFPNVVIEAMSLGKPVVGTEIGGIPEQIENNKTGILVKPQNSEELKSAIIRLASDSSLMHKFSFEAKKKFESLFEKSISIQKYHDLYKSLL
jgi:glycosyltransferase involved in cell wall biosynthesis